MKRKIFSVLFALVLICSLGLVMGSPVAADVSSATVTVEPTAVGETAKYTIDFTTGAAGGLPVNDNITVTFPSDTTVPGTTPLYDDGDITVNGEDVPGDHISVNGLAVTISTPVSISELEAVKVIFILSAGIKNPTTAKDYTLEVATSAETTKVTSAAYAITGLPTVDTVQPDRGNAGETMWVEVKGTDFTGTTTLSSTSFSFGDGVEVEVVDGSYHYVSATEVDCQITISPTATAGARDVTAESTAGPGVAKADAFTVGLALTQQVDVWDTYSPDLDLLTAGEWDVETLAMSVAVQTTIEDAVGYGLRTVGNVAGVATDNDVVRVHEAEYNPAGRYPIRIANSGLKLVAFGSPVIVPVRGGGNAFTEGVINIRATGVIVDGFTIQNADPFISGDHGIRAENWGGTFLIKNNTISGFGSSDPAAAWANCVAISAMVVTGTIQDNTVKDSRTGIELSASNGTTIQGNTVQNNLIGIALFGSTDVIVTQNSVLSNITGIDVCTGSTFATATFQLNDIVGNVIGLQDDGATIDAKYNYWGSIGGPSADAEAVTQSTALGNGDAISDKVTYNPWLSVSYVTVVADGKRYYGSDSLTLQAGWNTLSVPLELYDLANTITEIKAMGTFLTTANYWNLIYEYDSVGGFVTPTTPLTPCRGYYIKMKVASRFPVLYSNSLGLPALELEPGWNLIGSAFGIDKLSEATWAVGGVSATGTHTEADDKGLIMTDDKASFAVGELIGLTIVNETDGSSGVITGNTGTTVTVTALTGGTDNNWDNGDIYSIVDTEAIMGIGAALDSIGDQVSAVISPSVPGQIGDPWSVIWKSNNVTNKMRTGEGYWVFMTDTGTLAGWEITPFYFNP